MALGAALVAVAAAAALVPLPAGLVERAYSGGFFAALQPILTSVSNTSHYAFFDPLIALVLAAWRLLAARDLRAKRGGWLFAGVRVIWRTVVWSAALYLVFLITWGLNYRRVPIVARVPYDAHAVTSDAALALARTSVDALNRLYDPAHAVGWIDAGEIDPVLARAFAGADREIGGAGLMVVGRPKRTMLDWYFRRAAVDGMTDPYFLETLVTSELLPFERPFVLAHEWSHLAGRADEGEANFLGWLACVQSAVPQQYSGWLFLYSEIVAGLRGPARANVSSALADGPRADLAAIRARLAREVSPRVSAAGWKVYDQYLKANRVPAGAASYAEVVRLVLGTKLTRDWHVDSHQSVHD